MHLPEKRKEPTLLEPKEVTEMMTLISADWKAAKNLSLNREFKFSNFKEGLHFVVALGNIAEELHHHPDIYLSWGKVKITLSTHSIGGLSKKDFKFAERIDAEYATFI